MTSPAWLWRIFEEGLGPGVVPHLCRFTCQTHRARAAARCFPARWGRSAQQRQRRSRSGSCCTRSALRITDCFMASFLDRARGRVGRGRTQRLMLVNCRKKTSAHVLDCIPWLRRETCESLNSRLRARLLPLDMVLLSRELSLVFVSHFWGSLLGEVVLGQGFGNSNHIARLCRVGKGGPGASIYPRRGFRRAHAQCRRNCELVRVATAERASCQVADHRPPLPTLQQLCDQPILSVGLMLKGCSGLRRCAPPSRLQAFSWIY